MTNANLKTLAAKDTYVRLTPTAKILHWTGILLVTTVWISAGLFGLYILAFYAAPLYQGDIGHWNKMLPGLYNKDSTAATTGIGLHFAMGGIILILGNIQLIDKVRNRWPVFHRWTGRVYVTASVLAALGGLIFIFVTGTIGGSVMNAGFGLYGILMFIAGVQTWRHAAAGRMEQHRAWAMRLYALAIGSWLYRMDYGFWLMLAKGIGHQHNFLGPFDRIMAFFFYIPNLFVAEIFIRSRKAMSNSFLNILSSLMIVFMTTFLVLGTYYFTKLYWGPAIVGWFSGGQHS